MFPMTENHHADARIESTRLRKMMGSSLITDSFGQSRYFFLIFSTSKTHHMHLVPYRWMGVLSNTRWYLLFSTIPVVTHKIILSLGDLTYKKFGVTPEPEVRSKLLNGTNPFLQSSDELLTSRRGRMVLCDTCFGWNFINALGSRSSRLVASRV